MVDARYCQLLARYNRWMNERLYAAAGQLTDDARKQDRGAFFGSIHRTLCHLVWGDRTWLARFLGQRYDVPAYGADLYDDFDTLSRERQRTDTDILAWAARVPQTWLGGSLEYRRASDGRIARLPGWVAAVHLFNHSTHHRSQASTLLKQAGVDPGVSDLPWMPGVTEVVDETPR